MKNITKQIILTLSAIALILLSGCNDAEYSALNNQLFLAETGTSTNAFKK